MKALLDWLDHRTGYKLLVHEALNEPIPGGARWRYVTGSMLTFCFVVQAITGMFLWAGYAPSTQTAWESVYYIQHEMTLGWLLRGIHHFAAQAMMVVLGLHFFQVIWLAWLCSANRMQAPSPPVCWWHTPCWSMMCTCLTGCSWPVMNLIWTR